MVVVVERCRCSVLALRRPLGAVEEVETLVVREGCPLVVVLHRLQLVVVAVAGAYLYHVSYASVLTAVSLRLPSCESTLSVDVLLREDREEAESVVPVQLGIKTSTTLAWLNRPISCFELISRFTRCFRKAFGRSKNLPYLAASTFGTGRLGRLDYFPASDPPSLCTSCRTRPTAEQRCIWIASISVLKLSFGGFFDMCRITVAPAQTAMRLRSNQHNSLAHSRIYSFMPLPYRSLTNYRHVASPALLGSLSLCKGDAL